MGLTKRERILIIVLISIILFYGYIKYIINPQLFKIRELRTNMENYEDILNENNYNPNEFNELNEKYKRYLISVDGYSKKFFTSIDQSNIIILLDRFMKNIELEITSVDFSEYRNENIGENDLIAISATLPFKGPYTSILEFLRQIRENDQKIVVKSINILNDNEDYVSGNLILDFYSTSPLNNRKENNNLNNKQLYSSSKLNPFTSIEEYINDTFTYPDEEDYVNANLDEIEIESEAEVELIKKDLLEGFENIDMFFVGNPRNIEGVISQDNNKEQGEYSLKFEYDFLRPREKNIANIVFDKEKPFIKIQPEYISISIYSYEQSDHKLGMILKDQVGKEYNILLTDKIDWIDWNNIEVELPESMTYPAYIQRIYLTNNSLESKVNGVFLLDNMEVAYRNILPHSYEPESNADTDKYIEYYVRKGDTIFNISKRFYNDYSKRFIIMEHNNIQDLNNIKIGQRLLIPKI